jgi:YHS domain-containing protein
MKRFSSVRNFLIIALLSFPAWSGDAIYLSDGVAISGYDVVSYHHSETPVKGSSQFSYQWNGAKWNFSSAENQKRFTDNPEQYAPQYGGFCAYAASKGSLAPTDPLAWTINNGKLYLNYSTSVHQVWSQDLKKNIQLADQNWPQLKR